MIIIPGVITMCQTGLDQNKSDRVVQACSHRPHRSRSPPARPSTRCSSSRASAGGAIKHRLRPTRHGHHVLAPLTMRDAGYDTSQPLPGHAKGYQGGYQPAPFIDMSVPYSVGGLYSTVDGLSRWDTALLAGRPQLV